MDPVDPSTTILFIFKKLTDKRSRLMALQEVKTFCKTADLHTRNQVVSKMTDSIVREVTADVVSEVAERLVRAEIARMKLTTD